MALPAVWRMGDVTFPAETYPLQAPVRCRTLALSRSKLPRPYIWCFRSFKRFTSPSTWRMWLRWTLFVWSISFRANRSQLPERAVVKWYATSADKALDIGIIALVPVCENRRHHFHSLIFPNNAIMVECNVYVVYQKTQKAVRSPGPSELPTCSCTAKWTHCSPRSG